MDRIKRTHYYPVTSDGTGLMGGLKPNMTFVCSVSVHRRGRKLSSTKMKFNTAPAGMSQPPCSAVEENMCMSLQHRSHLSPQQ